MVNNKELLQRYASKKTEKRKLWLINKFATGSVIDLGCGPGEYLEYLASKNNSCVGLDLDFSLCKLAKNFTKVIVGNLNKLPIKKNSFDTIWASEIIEHLPNLNIFDELESIARDKIIITLPNPTSPHFREDPTHILQYTIKALKQFVKNRDSWAYKVIGLGFENVPLPRVLKDFSSFILRNVPELSPTIAIIGCKL